MVRLSGFYIFLLFVFIPLCVCADTGIDTLVITGKTYSYVTDAQQMDASEALPGARADAAEWLQGFAGLQVDSRSNYAQDTRITLRGFGARSAFGVRGVDLYIDGIPLTMPDGQGQFSGVPLDNIKHMTVLSGPVASLYGNAAGGVINLQTSVPDANRVQFGGAMDEAGLARQQLSGEWQQNNIALRIQANYLNAEGTRAHASAEREQLGIQGYYHFDNGVLTQWRFDKEKSPLLEDPLGLTPLQWKENPEQVNASAEFFNARKSIDHQQNAFSIRQAEGDQRWQFAIWLGERDIEQFLAQKGDVSGGVVNLKRKFSGGIGNYTVDFNVAEHPGSFTLGGELSAMNDRRKGYVNNNGDAGDLRRNELGQVENRDGYALLQWQVTNELQWLLGARHSQVSFNVNDYFIIPGKNADDSGEHSFNHLITTMATRYQLDRVWAVHAAVGNGFETPTLTETAYTTGDRGFNQTLDAAHNKQREVGLDFHRGYFMLSLNYFNIDTADEIVVDQSQNGRTSYLNAGATERKGYEFLGEADWAPTFHGRFSVSYLDATYTEGIWSMMRLPGVARLNEFIQFNWRPLANEYVNLGLSWAHRSMVATSDDNLVNAPAYATSDLSISGNKQLFSEKSATWRADWWVKLTNIMNKQYVGSVIVNQTNGRAFEPAPGRNLSGGLSLQYDF